MKLPLDPEPWETNSFSAHLLGERSSERVNRYSRFKPRHGFEQSRSLYDQCRACGGANPCLGSEEDPCTHIQ